MVRSVIFDFDGVILESLDIKARAFKRLYDPYGEDISRKVKEHHLRNGGISRFDKFKHYHGKYLNKSLDQKEIEHLSDRFSEIVVEEILTVSFVKGAKEFIEKNYKKYLMFISSATPHVELIEICKKRKIFNYFKEILGSPQSKTQHILHIKK